MNDVSCSTRLKTSSTAAFPSLPLCVCVCVVLPSPIVNPTSTSHHSKTEPFFCFLPFWIFTVTIRTNWACTMTLYYTLVSCLLTRLFLSYMLLTSINRGIRPAGVWDGHVPWPGHSRPLRGQTQGFYIHTRESHSGQDPACVEGEWETHTRFSFQNRKLILLHRSPSSSSWSCSLIAWTACIACNWTSMLSTGNPVLWG